MSPKGCISVFACSHKNAVAQVFLLCFTLILWSGLGRLSVIYLFCYAGAFARAESWSAAREGLKKGGITFILVSNDILKPPLT